MIRLVLKVLALSIMVFVGFGSAEQANAETTPAAMSCTTANYVTCEPEEGCVDKYIQWCYDDLPSEECVDPDPPPPPPPCDNCSGSCDIELVEGPCENTVYYEERCY